MEFDAADVRLKQKQRKKEKILRFQKLQITKTTHQHCLWDEKLINVVELASEKEIG